MTMATTKAGRDRKRADDGERQHQPSPTPDMWRPKGELPAAARAEAVPDKLAFDMVWRLQEQSAKRTMTRQHAQFRENPHGHVPDAVLIAPNGNLLGLAAGLGLAAACNERLACVEMLEHLLAPLAELANRVPTTDSTVGQALAVGVSELLSRYEGEIRRHRGPVEERLEVLPLPPARPER